MTSSPETRVCPKCGGRVHWSDVDGYATCTVCDIDYGRTKFQALPLWEPTSEN